MPNSHFKSAKITGIVTVVPPTVKCIDDEIDLYGGNVKQIARIKKAVGLNKRHVVSPNMTALDLCFAASNELFLLLAIEKESIDAVIFVTQTPDHFQPGNAAILHGRLGLKTSTASFDVTLGCSGYVYGLWLAHMMVEVGGCSNVLLVAGDTLSQCVNKQDRAAAPLFGDAGSATLIQKSINKENSYFSLHTDGSGYQHIMQPAGAFRTPSSDKTKLVSIDEDGNHRCEENLQMNGSEVFNFSIKVEPSAITEILEFSEKSMHNIDYFFFHQANQYIISNIARRLKLDKNKVPSDIVSKYGNQSSASIPCAICETLNHENKVDDVVLSGFGVGLSWASAVVSLNDTKISNVKILN
ncbi:3-oxoacyl-[acyl-carrier-protein] synthase III C-terminal domain-containing protein [Vibrio lentus]|uniref:3-oxoacyl-ACP synthase n=1 Tax=Vibrio lentus TaxID=136468 RepID=A0A2N7IAA4_9VIBR|nr:3-oxoacyl-[acyl-carrier-protein] synthase III C-terminal domain-containing protein [Vibrio lentus]PML53290.1 3-oxoacyl-ACP synthase [Vibrio lentus]PMM38486.1 3-oxoacyl-ACP synthase [Vibrio lentus]